MALKYKDHDNVIMYYMEIRCFVYLSNNSIHPVRLFCLCVHVKRNMEIINAAFFSISDVKIGEIHNKSKMAHTKDSVETTSDFVVKKFNIYQSQSHLIYSNI